MKRTEAQFWQHLHRVMGSRWRAQRHEDSYSSDIPDVSYSCGGMDGWMELKTLPHWPHLDRPLNLLPSYFTPGQRNWLVTHGRSGSGHCYVFLNVAHDFLLIRWDQFMQLGVWTRADWRCNAAAYWTGRIDVNKLAQVLSTNLRQLDLFDS